MSDVIMVMLPLSVETRHLVGADLLRRMRACAFLVNVGRGSVVSEEAVADALEAGTWAAMRLTWSPWRTGHCPVTWLASRTGCCAIPGPCSPRTSARPWTTCDVGCPSRRHASYGRFSKKAGHPTTLSARQRADLS